MCSTPSPVPPLNVWGSLIYFAVAGALLYASVRIGIPWFVSVTGAEPIVGGFVLGAIGGFLRTRGSA